MLPLTASCRTQLCVDKHCRSSPNTQQQLCTVLRSMSNLNLHTHSAKAWFPSLSCLLRPLPLLLLLLGLCLQAGPQGLRACHNYWLVVPVSTHRLPRQAPLVAAAAAAAPAAAAAAGWACSWWMLSVQSRQAPLASIHARPWDRSPCWVVYNPAAFPPSLPPTHETRGMGTKPPPRGPLIYFCRTSMSSFVSCIAVPTCDAPL
jgi:hypothetical protein